MFSIFNAYDDEGYFLVTLRDYLLGRSLFTQIPTIYGPFFYESMGGLFRLLALETSNDSGRLATIAVWLMASLMGGLAAFRMTQNPWLGLGAQFVTFHVLAALIDEPMHPSGLVSLLLMCLVVAATFRSARPRTTSAFIGAIVGALCLVKINVGAFAAIAVAFALAGSLTRRYRRMFLPLMTLVVATLPPVLMAPLLSRDWVLEYAAVAALSGAAVGVACTAAAPRYLPPPSVGWLAVGGAGIVIACFGIAMTSGTGLADLFNESVVIASRQPQVFVLPIRIGVVDVLCAALSLAVALGIFSRAHAVAPPAVIGLMRVAVGFLTWMALLRLPTSVFLLALPLAWVAIQPSRNDADDPTSAYARLLLPALAVLESLQAYPVAGTQLSVAALALVPVGAISIGDGIRQLRLAGRGARPPLVNQGAWVAPATLLLSIAAFLLFGFYATAGFIAGTPLGLPGAELVRVPPQQGTDLRSLVAAIDRDCGSFITFPGMNSFYLWTGQEPPVQLYSGGGRGPGGQLIDAHAWMFVLDSEAQQSAVQEIEGRPRLCVVKNQLVIDFWSEGRPVPRRPLVDFIEQNFVEAGTYGDYELLVRAGT